MRDRMERLLRHVRCLLGYIHQTMSLQKFLLQNLRTVKICHLPNPSLNPKTKIADTIICTILITSTLQSIPSTTTTLLSKLTPQFLHLILSDPLIKIPRCLDFFNCLVKNQSFLSFKLNLETHFSLICRLVQSRRFTDAENLLTSFLIHENFRCPFCDVAIFFENNFVEPVISAKVFNLMLKVYSDRQEFEMALETFDFMKKNGVEVNERTCTVYLIELMRNDKLELGLEFFYRMIESNIDVSVFSLTVVINGLCRNGEIQRARELVEEMLGRGIKPNIVSWNILVGVCVKRWNFEELNQILALMRKEEVEFSAETYKLLIDGFSSSGKIEDCELVVNEMLNKGFRVDSYTYYLVINGYCRLGNVEGAFSLFYIMSDRNVNPNSDTYWALMNACCKTGQMQTVKGLLEEMRQEGIECDEEMFNSLICAYCKQHIMEEALLLLVRMLMKGFFPEISVFEMVINSLSQSGRSGEAKSLLSTLLKRGMIAIYMNFIQLLEPPRRLDDIRWASLEEDVEIISDSDLYDELMNILLDGK